MFLYDKASTLVAQMKKYPSIPSTFKFMPRFTLTELHICYLNVSTRGEKTENVLN